MPLRNVTVYVGVCAIVVPGGRRIQLLRPECNGPTELHLTAPNDLWQIRWLGVDEKWQIALEDYFSGGPQIDEANITIVVQYTPGWMPSLWQNTKEFRFVTKMRSDNKIYWVPTPLNR